MYRKELMFHGTSAVKTLIGSRYKCRKELKFHGTDGRV